MRILIVEDHLGRISDLCGNLYRAGIVPDDLRAVADASSAYDAIRHSGPWDLVFLDHDLGNRSFVSSDDPNTGGYVARTVPLSIWMHQGLVIIHSTNDAGADYMMKLIPNAVRLREAWKEDVFPQVLAHLKERGL